MKQPPELYNPERRRDIIYYVSVDKLIVWNVLGASCFSFRSSYTDIIVEC